MADGQKVAFSRESEKNLFEMNRTFKLDRKVYINVIFANEKLDKKTLKIGSFLKVRYLI